MRPAHHPLPTAEILAEYAQRGQHQRADSMRTKPLMLSTALNSPVDAFNLLLRWQLEKRAVLENLDLFVLCPDEAVGDGISTVAIIVANHGHISSIIPDTDSTAPASRLLRSKADTTETAINEQTVMNALQIMGERVRGQIARGLGGGGRVTAGEGEGRTSGVEYIACST
ncbi:hypothetical protein GGG16DRAFT_104900 [Schizophyllum commune]